MGIRHGEGLVWTCFSPMRSRPIHCVLMPVPVAPPIHFSSTAPSTSGAEGRGLQYPIREPNSTRLPAGSRPAGSRSRPRKHSCPGRAIPASCLAAPAVLTDLYGRYSMFGIMEERSGVESNPGGNEAPSGSGAKPGLSARHFAH